MTIEEAIAIVEEELYLTRSALDSLEIVGTERKELEMLIDYDETVLHALKRCKRIDREKTYKKNLPCIGILEGKCSAYRDGWNDCLEWAKEGENRKH